MPSDESTSAVQERARRIATRRGSIYVRESAGTGPAIVMTHGFPDDSRIYNRLVPELSGHRVVTFDFLGHGRSDRENEPGPVLPGQYESDLDAVVNDLGEDKVVLVGHDAGGPVVMNWALDNVDRVHTIILLNTYYGHTPTLHLPEMIRLFADRHFSPLADAIVADPQLRGWLLAHTGGRFGVEREGPEAVAEVSVVPQFFGDADQPDAVRAIRAWTAELFLDLALQDHRIASGELSRLKVPTSLIFGADDTYLNTGVADHIAGYLPQATVTPVQGASHWPQWDQPSQTATAILQAVQQGI